jgi:hypothetical protein
MMTAKQIPLRKLRTESKASPFATPIKIDMRTTKPEYVGQAWETQNQAYLV